MILELELYSFTLRDLINAKIQLDEEFNFFEKTKILTDLLEILYEMYLNYTVHNDIKSQNVQYLTSNFFVLSNFGVA